MAKKEKRKLKECKNFIKNKMTGNIWLGAEVNTLLWTIVIVSITVASFGYIF